jgi:predicted nucleic acid-binding protein
VILVDANVLIALVDEHDAYDREFRTVWRQPNGTRIPLFAQ